MPLLGVFTVEMMHSFLVHFRTNFGFNVRGLNTELGGAKTEVGDLAPSRPPLL